MKKILISVLAFMLCTSMAPALAAQLASASQPPNASQSARIEETEWKYRIVNGVSQKRLWSITYGYWKTDWTNCL